MSSEQEPAKTLTGRWTDVIRAVLRSERVVLDRIYSIEENNGVLSNRQAALSYVGGLAVICSTLRLLTSRTCF
jgi:hypothetical protein